MPDRVREGTIVALDDGETEVYVGPYLKTLDCYAIGVRKGEAIGRLASAKIIEAGTVVAQTGKERSDG